MKRNAGCSRTERHFFCTPATFSRRATQTKKMVHLFYYTPKKAFLTLPPTHSENPGVGRTGHSNQNRKAFGRKDLPLGLQLCGKNIQFGESIVSMSLSNAITAWGIVKAAGAQRCFPKLSMAAVVKAWSRADTCRGGQAISASI